MITFIVIIIAPVVLLCIEMQIAVYSHYPFPSSRQGSPDIIIWQGSSPKLWSYKGHPRGLHMIIWQGSTPHTWVIIWQESGPTHSKYMHWQKKLDYQGCMYNLSKCGWCSIGKKLLKDPCIGKKLLSQMELLLHLSGGHHSHSKRLPQAASLIIHLFTKTKPKINTNTETKTNTNTNANTETEDKAMITSATQRDCHKQLL